MSVRILVGSALDVLRGLESESVQCVVTSPPYFQLRDYGVEGQIGLEHTPAEFIAALMAVFDEVRRVLRPDGLCFVNISDSYAGSGKGPSGHNGIGDQGQRQGFVGSKQRTNAGSVTMGSHEYEYRGIPAKNLLLIPQRFAIAMQDAGWVVRQEIIWGKKSCMPESVRDRFTRSWEPVFMFSKQARYYFDQEANRQPFTGHAQGDKGVADDQKWVEWYGAAGQRIRHGKGATGLRTHENHAGANMRDVWMLSPEPSRLEHYASYPTELVRRCILAGSRPGDTVLDPFLGSGTTALVADRLGRDAIGIELSPSYAAMARERIERDAGGLFADPVAVERPVQPSLLGAEEGVAS